MRRAWAAAAPWLLAGLLATAGVLHLVAPRPFEALIPEALPGPPRAWVLGSGAAELACAAAVALPATRRIGGWATAALFVAVFPGNVQMALDGGARGVDGWLGSAAVAWARLPLQVPLVLWAVGVARRAAGVTGGRDRVGGPRPTTTDQRRPG